MTFRQDNQESVSVVVATYNGEKFICEQLWSIANQTLEPSEIIVTDDGSTDRTKELVMAFREKTKIPTFIIENSGVPRGVTGNFEVGLKAARSEIVAFADQDDVWTVEKLEKIVPEFGNEVGWVCSDATIVDSDLKTMRVSLFEQIGFNPNEFNALSSEHQLVLLLKRPHVIYGMSLAVRRRVARALLPMTSKSSNFTHDAWMSLGIVGMGFRGRVVVERLVMYRAHPKQIAGAPRATVGWLQKVVYSIKKTRKHDKDLPSALDSLACRITNAQELSANGNCEWASTMISMLGLHLSQRIKAHEANRFSSIWLTLNEVLSGRFHKVGGGVQTALRDIIG